MLNQMYEQYCANRLPCGICRLTNSQCPKACGIDITCVKTADSITTQTGDTVTRTYSTKIGDIATEVHC